MAWITAGNDRETIMRSLPGIGDHFAQLYQSFWELPHIPAGILELCRLRLAQLHNSHTDWELEQYPLNPEKKANLRQWSKHAAFTDAERACLALTEVHAMDAQAITDEQADAVKAHFGEVGLVALIQALGVFDGMIRLGLLWGLSAPEGEG
ncbi:MAG: carboxymuconolactone decarboxylase family protein [Lysobacterales bacterium]